MTVANNPVTAKSPCTGQSRRRGTHPRPALAWAAPLIAAGLLVAGPAEAGRASQSRASTVNIATEAGLPAGCMPDDFYSFLQDNPAPPSEDFPAQPGAEPDSSPSEAPPSDRPPAPPLDTTDPCPWRANLAGTGSPHGNFGKRKLVRGLIVGRRGRILTARVEFSAASDWQVCLGLAGSRSATRRCRSGRSRPGTTTVRLPLSASARRSRTLSLTISDRRVGARESFTVRFTRHRQWVVIRRAPASTTHLAHASGDGYPDGTGVWQPGGPFSDWVRQVLNVNWWLGFTFSTCFDASARYFFITYYKREQQHIRDHFAPGYMLGRPITGMRMKADGFASTRWRLYQIFDGGSWGRSSLTAARARYLTGACSEAPHLITGVIYRKWERLGHVNRLGGPLGGQYRSGPFIRQDFENGQIGFRDGNLGTVWWRYWNGGWQL